jgi:hypothetical protein
VFPPSENDPEDAAMEEGVVAVSHNTSIENSDIDATREERGKIRWRALLDVHWHLYLGSCRRNAKINPEGQI